MLCTSRSFVVFGDILLFVFSPPPPFFFFFFFFFFFSFFSSTFFFFFFPPPPLSFINSVVVLFSLFRSNIFTCLRSLVFLVLCFCLAMSCTCAALVRRDKHGRYIANIKLVSSSSKTNSKTVSSS